MIKPKVTIPRLAKLWGISSKKILVWINSGELPAINAAKSIGERPRYLIGPDDIASFENSRAVKPISA